MQTEFWLFSYGTLRQQEVQLRVFGRQLATFDDALSGFALETVRITDPAVIETSGSDCHPILKRAAAESIITGAAIRLSAADLEKADRYEAADYARIAVKLVSGRSAFAYVQKSSDLPSNAAEAVTLIEPDVALARRLLPVARRIFTDTFADRYDHAPFRAFCDATYSAGGPMDRDLQSADVEWRVAVADGEPIGYAKLTPLRAPAADAAPGTLELQQIYVLSDWHGAGVSDRLIEWAIARAAERHAPALYLTVFDHNERAKRFYARWGFQDVGHCTFQLGDRIDDDRIWRRTLAAA